MTHTDYMRRALSLAKRGRTSPNPMVGAIVVKDGVIVGEGYHPKAGEPHAEVFALRKAGDSAKRAALYVTLEPCCHYGRTPPCTQAILDAGISDVYYAMADPDPRVARKGLDRLVKAGVSVHGPVLEDEARKLNEAYIKHRTTGLPFVILKSAMSLDGKIATKTGDSKWITGEKARAYAHKIRSRVDAIIVGSNTARTDNPLLTARVGKQTRYPARIVVTRSGDIPANLRLVDAPGEVIVAAWPGVDTVKLAKLERAGVRIIHLGEMGKQASISVLLRYLGEMGYLSVLIEGGGEIAASALEEGVVDKAMLYYAPKIIGGRDAVPSVGGLGVDKVESAIKLDNIRVKRLGDDILVEGYIMKPRD